MDSGIIGIPLTQMHRDTERNSEGVLCVSVPLCQDFCFSRYSPLHLVEEFYQECGVHIPLGGVLIVCRKREDALAVGSNVKVGRSARKTNRRIAPPLRLPHR